MRSRPFTIPSLLSCVALVGITAAVLEGCTLRPGANAVSNPRYGAYRCYISRSGKPRGIYKKHGLSSAARRRSIAGVKKRRRNKR